MDHKVKYDSDSIKRVDTVCFLLKEFDVYHTGYFYPPKKLVKCIYMYMLGTTLV